MSAFVNVNDANFNDDSKWEELSAEIDANREEYQNNVVEDDVDWNAIVAEIKAYCQVYQNDIDTHDYEGVQSELSEEEQEKLNFREMHIHLLEMQGHSRCEAEIVVGYYESIHQL